MLGLPQRINLVSLDLDSYGKFSLRSFDLVVWEAYPTPTHISTTCKVALYTWTCNLKKLSWAILSIGHDIDQSFGSSISHKILHPIDKTSHCHQDKEEHYAERELRVDIRAYQCYQQTDENCRCKRLQVISFQSRVCSKWRCVSNCLSKVSQIPTCQCGRTANDHQIDGQIDCHPDDGKSHTHQ